MWLVRVPAFWVTLLTLSLRLTSAAGLDSPLLTIDTVGPRMLSAELSATVAGNVIDVIFDEAPLSHTATTNNFQVIRSGTAGAGAVVVAVTNVQVNGRVARLKVTGPNWNLTDCYYVLVSGVTDNLGNMIPAKSVIGITMSPGGAPCPAPDDAPLENLRLEIQPDVDRNTRARVTWPSGYYGFSLESLETDASAVTQIWQPVTIQTNGYLVLEGPNRMFRLRK